MKVKVYKFKKYGWELTIKFYPNGTFNIWSNDETHYQSDVDWKEECEPEEIPRKGVGKWEERKAIANEALKFLMQ